MSRTGASRSLPSRSRSEVSGKDSAVLEKQCRPDDLAGRDLADDGGLHTLNLAKADAIQRWLSGVDDITEDDAGRLSADLSDLYAGAIHYHHLLDALLATPPDERARASDLLVDAAVELRHLAWHIRSCVGRLERLADKLDPDELDPDDDG